MYKITRVLRFLGILEIIGIHKSHIFTVDISEPAHIILENQIGEQPRLMHSLIIAFTNAPSGNLHMHAFSPQPLLIRNIVIIWNLKSF